MSPYISVVGIFWTYLMAFRFGFGKIKNCEFKDCLYEKKTNYTYSQFLTCL